jgi:hypothetical protein
VTEQPERRSPTRRWLWTLTPDTPVWSRQHQAIEINADLGVITDDGRELVAYLRAQNRDVVLMTRVHTNMCILRRLFGLVALAATPRT